MSAISIPSMWRRRRMVCCLSGSRSTIRIIFSMRCRSSSSAGGGMLRSSIPVVSCLRRMMLMQRFRTMMNASESTGGESWSRNCHTLSMASCTTSSASSSSPRIPLACPMSLSLSRLNSVLYSFWFIRSAPVCFWCAHK